MSTTNKSKTDAAPNLAGERVRNKEMRRKWGDPCRIRQLNADQSRIEKTNRYSRVAWLVLPACAGCLVAAGIVGLVIAGHLYSALFMIGAVLVATAITVRNS